MHRHRRGFTLVEILIVIGVLLVLTYLTVAIFRGTSGDRIRTAGRLGQSAILGARDRALHAKEKRGFRIIRDPQDSGAGIGFAYLQPIETLTYGPQSIQLERPDWNANGVVDTDEQDVVIVRGFDLPDAIPHTDWHTLTDFFASPARIRIPAGTGQWYVFFWANSGPYALNASNQYLQLTTPYIDPGTPGFVAHDRFSTFSSCDIEMASELLPNHAPISLPSGVLIDLNYSPDIAARWPAPANIDIMFTPRGTVSGYLAALGPIHFLLRDVRDMTEGNNPHWVGVDNPADPLQQAQKHETMILTIFPQTGHVATYPIDPTDADANGQADDLFRFAKIGSQAGG
jgi:prepilin-type N-terminal cleavage/methylation domain-containing protein